MTTRIRWITFAWLAFVVALGLAFRAYRGPLQNFVNHFGPASVCYVVFFILLVFWVSPRSAAIWPISAGVFIGTCLVEFAQLWHFGWLETLRATTAGRLLLGNSFSWWDFPAYVLGGVAGWCLCHAIVNSQRAKLPAGTSNAER